jgi:hypothetical protein
MPDDVKKLGVAIEATSNLPETAAKDAEAMGNVSKATKETKEQMELLKPPTDEVRRITTELDRAVNGLGEAFRVLRSPIIGSVGAAIGLFVELRQYINETNKALDEMAEKNAAADFLSNLATNAAAVSEAAAGLQGFLDTLAHVGDAYQAINTKLEDQLKLMQAVERAKANLDSAQKAEAIAKIQEDEAAQRVSPLQAAQARAAVEKQAAELAEQRREESEDTDLQAKQDALAKAKQQQASLEDAAIAAKAAVDAKKQHEGAVSLDPAQQLEKIDAAQKALDALAQSTASKHGVTASLLNMAPEQMSDVQQQAVRDIWQEVNASPEHAKVVQLQEELNSYRKATGPMAGQEDKALLDAAADAEKKATENKTLIEKLAHDIAQEIKTSSVTRPMERQATAVTESAIDSGVAAQVDKLFEANAKFFQKFDISSHLTPELIEQAIRKVEEQNELNDKFASLVQKLADWKISQRNMATAISILDSQAAHSSDNTFSQ